MFLLNNVWDDRKLGLCMSTRVQNMPKSAMETRLLTSWSYRLIITKAEVSSRAKQSNDSANVELAGSGQGPKDTLLSSPCVYCPE